MDLPRLARETAGTNSAEHLKALHDHAILQFSYDQNIKDILRQKERAQQTMMLRNYLHKYADVWLLRELRDVLDTFGETCDNVADCMRGLLRSAQTQIYALCAVFDTDDFRLQHMAPKSAGSAATAPEEYWERASEVNTWRSVVDVEALKIVADAALRLSAMRARAAALSEADFAAHPEHAAFCGQARGKRTRAY